MNWWYVIGSIAAVWVFLIILFVGFFTIAGWRDFKRGEQK